VPDGWSFLGIHKDLSTQLGGRGRNAYPRGDPKPKHWATRVCVRTNNLYVGLSALAPLGVLFMGLRPMLVCIAPLELEFLTQALKPHLRGCESAKETQGQSVGLPALAYLDAKTLGLPGCKGVYLTNAIVPLKGIQNQEAVRMGLRIS
jgi:hypothetical protein